MSNAQALPALAVRHARGIRALFIPSLLTCVLLASPRIATAQIAEPVGVCVDVRGCDSGGNSGGGNSGSMLSGSPSTVILQSMFYGGGLGALGGSLATDVNGENQWMTGSLAGFGLFLEMGTLKNKWGRLYKAFTGAVAFGAAGAAYGKYLDGQIETGSEEDLSTESKMLPMALKAAAAGGVVNLAVPTGFDLSHFPVLRRFIKSPTPLKLINNGKRIGVRVAW